MIAECCGVAKLVRRLIVNQETRRFESGPHSHFSGSRLDGKPPALGAGESEFDSRDPDLNVGTRCCWRHAGPANPTDGFEPHSLHHIAAVAEWSRREFPKLVDAGSSPAGSFVRARVAQRKSATRGEGLRRDQISSRAPKNCGLRIEDCGLRIDWAGSPRIRIAL